MTGGFRRRCDPDPNPTLSVHDSDGAVPVLRLSRQAFPVHPRAFADVGYDSDRPAMATIVTVEMVRKSPGQIDFAVHSRRWVVERSFAQINRNRRLWKNYEATIASAKAFLYTAAVTILSRLLIRASRDIGRTLSRPNLLECGFG